MSYYERRLLEERLLSVASRISRLSLCSEAPEERVDRASYEERLFTLTLLTCKEILEIRKGGQRKCLPISFRLLIRDALAQLSYKEISSALTKTLEYEILGEMKNVQGFISELKHLVRILARRITLKDVINLIALIVKMIEIPCLNDAPQSLRERLSALDKRMKVYGIFLSITFPAFFILLVLGYFYVSLLVLFLTIALWISILKDGSVYSDLNADRAWLTCSLSLREIEYIIRGPLLEVPIYSLLFRRE